MDKYKCVFANKIFEIHCKENYCLDYLFNQQKFNANYHVKNCIVKIIGQITEDTYINSKVLLANNAEIIANIYCNKLLLSEITTNCLDNCYAKKLYVLNK
jgi:hypothetical protein